MKQGALLLLCLLLAQGCATSVTMTAKQGPARLVVGHANLAGTTPLTGPIHRTSFGEYPVMVQKDGSATFYAMLPLQENARVIVADMLLCFPVVWFKAKEAAVAYEFDLEKNVIRCNRDGAWLEYPVKPGEQQAARKFFGQ